MRITVFDAVHLDMRSILHGVKKYYAFNSTYLQISCIILRDENLITYSYF